MQKLKDKLYNLLGMTGLIIGYAILLLWFSFPLVFLDFNFIIDAILIYIMITIPIIGPLCEFVLWVWSLLIVIKEPLNVFTVIYYIILAVYVFGSLLPTLYSFIKTLWYQHKYNK